MILILCASFTGCDHFVSILPGSEITLDGEDNIPDQGDPSQSGEFQEQPLLEFIGWNSFAESYYEDTPLALSMRIGDGFNSPIFDRASIIAACDALRSMKVSGRLSETDSSEQKITFTFTMDDEEAYPITFAGKNLYLTSGIYGISGGDALWNLEFPGYSGNFDIFDLYSSERIRTFADSFYQNIPVSVGRRQNGGATLTSQDSSVVQQVFSLLDQATVVRVEQYPDQNIDLTQTTDYVFTMSDASAYTFSFTGPCLTVTVASDYGPVYYWLQGVDDLPYVPVVPESKIPTFDGGPLANLRTEIAQAQSAAYGLLEGISILGVYVDYTINGLSDYLTLSGDTANNFIQQVTSINVSSETVSGGGDVITIFVTLSDQSGPIIVFNGDSVQQVVGVNYACDSSAMGNLRNTILQLAQDENNHSSLIENSSA